MSCSILYFVCDILYASKTYYQGRRGQGGEVKISQYCPGGGGKEFEDIGHLFAHF